MFSSARAIQMIGFGDRFRRLRSRSPYSAVDAHNGWRGRQAAVDVEQWRMVVDQREKLHNQYIAIDTTLRDLEAADERRCEYSAQVERACVIELEVRSMR